MVLNACQLVRPHLYAHVHQATQDKHVRKQSATVLSIRVLTMARVSHRRQVIRVNVPTDGQTHVAALSSMCAHLVRADKMVFVS